MTNSSSGTSVSSTCIGRRSITSCLWVIFSSLSALGIGQQFSTLSLRLPSPRLQRIGISWKHTVLHEVLTASQVRVTMFLAGPVGGTFLRLERVDLWFSDILDFEKYLMICHFNSLSIFPASRSEDLDVQWAHQIYWSLKFGTGYLTTVRKPGWMKPIMHQEQHDAKVCYDVASSRKNVTNRKL